MVIPIKIVFGLFLIQWKIGGVLVTIKGCLSDLEYNHLAECISVPFLIPLFPYFFPRVHTK